MKYYKFLPLSLSLFLGLCFTPDFLFAEEAEEGIEEVIVTANKKEETLMEIPMNISVITEATLDERGILNPEDYLRSIAGVSTPGGSNYYTFRGLNKEIQRIIKSNVFTPSLPIRTRLFPLDLMFKLIGTYLTS